jgi:hypothetical protein
MGLGFSKLIFEFCGALAVGYDLGLFLWCFVSSAVAVGYGFGGFLI